MRRFNTTIQLTILSLISTSLFAGDWPQFQGPDRNGVSKETGIAKNWPKSGPKQIWKIDTGEGYGGAAIVGNEVFFLDRVDSEKNVLRCLDFKTGKELWKVEAKSEGRVNYPGSRGTPTVDENYVFAAGPLQHLYCFDRKAKKLLWDIDVNDTFNKETPRFGFACSPLLYKDSIIASPLSESVGLVRLDKKTGKVIWKSKDIGNRSYASPLMVNLAGVECLAIVTNDRIAFIDPEDGKIITTFNDFECRAPIPLPTIINENHLFITAGYKTGSLMLKATKTSDGFTVKDVFRLEDHGSQIHQVILHKDHLFGNFNENDNLRRGRENGIMCIDLKGNIIWQTHENLEVDRGAILFADDMFFVIGAETGTLTLIEANPKKYVQLAQAKILNGDENMFAPMALSNGMLIIRDHESMQCLDVRAKTYAKAK